MHNLIRKVIKALLFLSLGLIVIFISAIILFDSPLNGNYKNWEYFRGEAAEISQQLHVGMTEREVRNVISGRPYIDIHLYDVDGYPPMWEIDFFGDPSASGNFSSCEMYIYFTHDLRVSSFSEEPDCLS
ncbi:MAG: hypothetical protein AAGD96_01140 [Chloroflexota bacterium]